MAMNPAQQGGSQVGGGNFTPASLYVGELKSEVTEAFLFEMFNTVGPVASIRVCRDVVTRRSLGYAYVNFHSVNDAERALDTMNFSMIRGHPCRIMWSQRDPSLRKSGVGNIFVKNLDKSIDHKTLYDTFSMFGSILSCKVATDENGESRGYGFVHYENQESADRAIQKVDGMVIAAREVHVKPFLPKSQRVGANNAQSFTNLYIKGLDKENVDEEKLKEMFSQFGKISSLHLARDKDQQKKSRGFGFVNFEEPDDARKAIEGMNDKDGLTVCRAQKREERDRVLRQSFDKLRLEQAEKYAGVNLYIKNLDDTLDDADLEKEFTGYGNIESAKIMRTPDGRSKGFGFVMFQSRDAAAKAVAEMNGKMLKQKPLYVALAQRKEERRQFLEAQAQVARTKMATMPHQMYGPPHAGPQHPGMFYQGGAQGMPQGPGGPQGPHMPPGTPMGVAPQMPRGGAQTPQGFMYGAPHNQMGMSDPRGPQGGMGGPQGGRGGPWAQGPRTPNGPGGMMMNQRGPPGPNMYMMGSGMHQGGRGGMGGGRGRGRGGRGGGDRGIQFQHGVRNNPQQAPTQQGPPTSGAVPQQSNGVPPQGAAAQPAAATVAPAQPAAAVAPGPLTSQALARAPAQQQKQMIGERIYPKIQEIEPTLAGKITGMLLEMDNTELLHLLESPEALKGKIDEAMIVLQQSGDAPAGAQAASKPAVGSADPAAASSGDDAAPAAAAAGDA